METAGHNIMNGNNKTELKQTISRKISIKQYKGRRLSIHWKQKYTLFLLDIYLFFRPKHNLRAHTVNSLGQFFVRWADKGCSIQKLCWRGWNMHVPTGHVLDTSKHPRDSQPDHQTTQLNFPYQGVSLRLCSIFHGIWLADIVVVGLLFKWETLI